MSRDGYKRWQSLSPQSDRSLLRAIALSSPLPPSTSPPLSAPFPPSLPLHHFPFSSPLSFPLPPPHPPPVTRRHFELDPVWRRGSKAGGPGEGGAQGGGAADKAGAGAVPAHGGCRGARRGFPQPARPLPPGPPPLPSLFCPLAPCCSSASGSRTLLCHLPPLPGPPVSSAIFLHFQVPQPPLPLSSTSGAPSLLYPFPLLPGPANSCTLVLYFRVPRPSV